MVLTAAHCIHFADQFLTYEFEGATPQPYDVRDRWASPNADIGLLWLWQPVPWTRAIKQHAPAANSIALVFGFGGNDRDVVPGLSFFPNNGILVKRAQFFRTPARAASTPPSSAAATRAGRSRHRSSP